MADVGRQPGRPGGIRGPKVRQISNDSSGSVSRRYRNGGQTGQTGGERAFAGTRPDDEDAPITAIGPASIELVKPTPKRTLCLSPGRARSRQQAGSLDANH